MNSKVKTFIFAVILTLLSPLFADKLIIQEIETVRNFQIEKYYFSTTFSDLPLKNYSSKTVFIPYKGNLKKAILTVFTSFPTNVLSKTFNSGSHLQDKIISKRYLILDTNYQIVNINKDKFYKFKVYAPHLKRKNLLIFLNKIMELYKIEYNIGDIK